MKLVAIISREYYNKDNQRISQVNSDIRKSLSTYDNISLISILPSENIYYQDIFNSEDNINTSKLNYILDKCDAFVIPGGTNWYKLDEYIIEYAIKKNKPLLAICLGFQALCSMYTINRNKFDMTKKINNNNHYGKSSKYIHSININKDSKLYKIINKELIKVNSLHHDYIEPHLKELKISALSEDNIVEAVEYPNKKFILGLQWHPEYLMDNNSQKIFDAFVKSI